MRRDEILKMASADYERVHKEVLEYEKNPAKYIERRRTELRDWDFPVFAAISFKILNKKFEPTRLYLNRIQRRLWRLILEDLIDGKPTRNIIIKFRQGGVSLFAAVFFYWICSMRKGRNAFIISHNDKSVKSFASRLRRLHEDNDSGLVSPTKQNRRDVIEFGNPTARGGSGKDRPRGAGLGSEIHFFAASSASLGRSFNLCGAHLSEFCFWEDQRKHKIDISEKMGGLLQAIPREVGTFVLIESTPNGVNKAKDFWDEAMKGLNGFRAIFLPWPAMDDYRKDLEEGETLELSSAEEIGGVPTRYGDERREARLVREILKDWYPEEVEKGGDEWLEREVLARLKWRRECIDKDCGGDKKAFRKEYPTTPADGFSATSRNCFDLDALESMRQFVAEEGIESRRYSFVDDSESEEENSRFVADSYGSLLVHEQPQLGALYVIGGDPSSGVPNGDPSSLVVLKVTEDALEEVASFNKVIRPDKLADLVFRLGRLYNNALVGIENNDRGGFVCNLRLHRELQYHPLYFQYDVYARKAASIPGFVTKASNKQMLVTGLNVRIRDGEIILRTPALLDQLEHYIELDDGSMGGSSGWHDDLVSAALIATHLSTKVHEVVPRDEPPPGSVAYDMKYGMNRKRKILRVR